MGYFPILAAVLVSILWIASRIILRSRKGEPVTAGILVVPALVMGVAIGGAVLGSQ